MIAQVYCKHLDLAGAEICQKAGADHVGWQIDLNEFESWESIQTRIKEYVKISEYLSDQKISSAFLVHPTLDGELIKKILDIVRPTIYFASGERSIETIRWLSRKKNAPQIMVPIGVPTKDCLLPDYDPISEMKNYSSFVQWFTTDTINPSESVESFGCSGKTGNWDAFPELIEKSPCPVIVSGGMNSKNILDVYKICKPFGFDAHSSVCKDGYPDLELAKEFAQAVHALDS